VLQAVAVVVLQVVHLWLTRSTVAMQRTAVQQLLANDSTEICSAHDEAGLVMSICTET
jgi:hypothetical protein